MVVCDAGLSFDHDEGIHSVFADVDDVSGVIDWDDEEIVHGVFHNGFTFLLEDADDGELSAFGSDNFADGVSAWEEVFGNVGTDEADAAAIFYFVVGEVASFGDFKGFDVFVIRGDADKVCIFNAVVFVFNDRARQICHEGNGFGEGGSASHFFELCVAW